MQCIGNYPKGTPILRVDYGIERLNPSRKKLHEAGIVLNDQNLDQPFKMLENREGF
jgi:hypothetical protein